VKLAGIRVTSPPDVSSLAVGPGSRREPETFQAEKGEEPYEDCVWNDPKLGIHIEMPTVLAEVLDEGQKQGRHWLQMLVMCANAGIVAAQDGTLLRLMAANMDKCSLPN